jgi:hypothetical protein
MPKRVRSTARELALALLVVSISVGVGAAQSAANGMLGVFFDSNGSKCDGIVAQGGMTTLYVLLAADGDTRAGISGAEFRIEMEGSGYRLFAEEVIFPNVKVQLGQALGEGINVAGDPCVNQVVVPMVRFQVQNLGGRSDAVISIEPKNPPSSPNVPCALVNLCDAPAYTAVCVRPGKAVLNPTGSIVCGSGAAASEWGRVKELYR